MKSVRNSVVLLAFAVGVAAAPLVAHDDKKHKAKPGAEATSAKGGKLMAVTPKDAAWAKQARKAYPLEVCLTSDEKLGSMGKSPEYIYRVEGKADRLVMFCCDGCEDDFIKDPAKYIAKLDAAAKAKGSAGK